MSIKKKQASRPKKVDTDIIRFQNNKEKWIGLVGLKNNEPFEIYAGNADDFWLPTWVKGGWIIKEKVANNNLRYDFQFEDRQGYKITIEGLSRSFDREYRNYSKIVSGLLQEGVSPKTLCNFLDNVSFDPSSVDALRKGLMKVLTYYIPEEELLSLK